jgi:hyperosmotically inducible protein
MKTNLAATCLILGTLLAPVATYAEDRDADRAHPMTYVKDSVITTKVKTKLADEKMSSLTRVQVDTDSNGVVVLSGNVRTEAEKVKAVSIARGTEGVTAVKSNLVVKKDD